MAARTDAALDHPLNRDFSASLNLVRVAAAMTVFLAHATQLHLAPAILSIQASDVGHSAVIVFFVLSGYVIAGGAARTDSLGGYTAARLARVYSVAVPAILLTGAIDLYLLAHGHGDGIPVYQLRAAFKYVPMFLTFTTDSWHMTESVFSNTPYWSLSYEVWYYALLGAFMFVRGPWRWVLVGLTLAAMGPRLWLLFPVWLIGVVVWATHRRTSLAVPAARVLGLGSVLGLVLIKQLGVEAWLNAGVDALAADWHANLRFSRWFLGDYAIGLCTGGAILGLRDAGIIFPRWIRTSATAGAGVSFSLYLTHLPLLRLLAFLLPGWPAVALVAALGGAVAFGVTFEPRRHWLRRRLAEWLSVLPVAMRVRAAPK